MQWRNENQAWLNRRGAQLLAGVKISAKAESENWRHGISWRIMAAASASAKENGIGDQAILRNSKINKRNRRRRRRRRNENNSNGNEANNENEGNESQ
jgi:hypothetical protein